MLPSQRTLRLMAAINEGNSNNVRLEAWFGSTTTRMVFDVLDHLCVWAGCDVCPPPSLSSPAAIGGISHRRRKQKLGNYRSPCACLANGFASENRAGGLRLCWQVPLLVVRARTASCYLLWVRTETLGFATTDGMVRETHGWRDLVLQVGCPTSTFCCLCLSLLSFLGGRAFWPHQLEHDGPVWNHGLCRRLEPLSGHAAHWCAFPFRCICYQTTWLAPVHRQSQMCNVLIFKQLPEDTVSLAASFSC